MGEPRGDGHDRGLALTHAAHLQRLLGLIPADGSYLSMMRFARATEPLPWRADQKAAAEGAGADAAARRPTSLVSDQSLADWVQAMFFRCVTHHAVRVADMVVCKPNLSAMTFVRLLHALLLAGHPPHVLQRAVSALLAGDDTVARVPPLQHYQPDERYDHPLFPTAYPSRPGVHPVFSAQLDDGHGLLRARPSDPHAISRALGPRHAVRARPYADELRTLLLVYRREVVLPLVVQSGVDADAATVVFEPEARMVPADQEMYGPTGELYRHSHDCGLSAAVMPAALLGGEAAPLLHGGLRGEPFRALLVDGLAAGRDDVHLYSAVEYELASSRVRFRLSRAVAESDTEQCVLFYVTGHYRLAFENSTCKLPK